MSIDIKGLILSRLGDKHFSQLSNEEFAQLLSDVLEHYGQENSRALQSRVQSFKSIY